MSALRTVPFLGCDESLAYERDLLGGDEEAEWQAMTRAGEGLADELARDPVSYTHLTLPTICSV